VKLHPVRTRDYAICASLFAWRKADFRRYRTTRSGFGQIAWPPPGAVTFCLKNRDKYDIGLWRGRLVTVP
jgi:hypothetical protein